MKYLVSAVKYFIFICLFVAFVLLILVLIGAVSSDIDVMFDQGWVSVAKIAAAPLEELSAQVGAELAMRIHDYLNE